jgi:lipopolysaccharide/colanic/teichoic acid biosynthesis glycosyltransferase
MLPVMFLIGLLILLEDGRPVFFGHWRQGRGGRLFTCWKFRSMIRNAEQVAHELEQYNSCDGPQVFIQDDPRVTRMGRILRPSHLDELPQLWNVLVGQMSLVGPRPSPDGENQFCPAWRDIRLSVRPGITGLWQLNRRREPGEDFQEWIRYDIRYVRRAGLRMDFKILVKTAWVMIFGRGDSAVQ